MLIFVVFFSIYSIVSITVINKVNEHINYEVEEYVEKINVTRTNVELLDPEEWDQREHNEVSVDPVFCR